MNLTRFNTASGMRSHVTEDASTCSAAFDVRFNTASGMRSHVTHEDGVNFPEDELVSIPQAV